MVPLTKETTTIKLKTMWSPTKFSKVKGDIWEKVVWEKSRKPEPIEIVSSIQKNEEENIK